MFLLAMLLIKEKKNILKITALRAGKMSYTVVPRDRKIFLQGK